MAIKRNEKGKWSVKGSDKYITYERIIDLTQENLDVLKKYDLKKSLYIYVGQCSEAKIDDRHSKIIWDIKNKITENKNIHFYIETSLTYLNIMRFFREQKNMTQKEVEDYLFRSEDNFFIVKEGLTKEESEQLEKNRYHGYIIACKMTNIVLLKNKDSQLEDSENSVQLKNIRKKDDVINPDLKIEIDAINKKQYIIINDIIKIEMKNLYLTPIIEKNGIIDEESLKKDKKIPSTSPNKEGF